MHHNLNFCTSIAALLLLIFANNNAWAATDKEGNKQTDAVEHRILHFPQVSLGFVRVTPRDQGSENKVPALAGAQGTVKVTVPHGCIVSLDLRGKVFQNLALLDAIRNEPIESMRIGFTSMDDSEEGTTDRVLAHVCLMRNLEEINADRSDATDKGLSLIHNMPQLRIVSIFLCEANGSCLKQIATCPNLRQLHFWNCQLDQSNLKYLSALQKLEFVNVSSTRLTNDGIKLIANCSGLKGLRACNDPIDDGCIDDLKKLKYLNYLDLAGTQITIGGIRRLKGLPLTRLVLPLSAGTVHDPELSKLFPGILIQHTGPKQVSKDDLELMAPMH